MNSKLFTVHNSKDEELNTVDLDTYTGQLDQKWRVVYLDGREERFSAQTTEGSCQTETAQCIR